jgi:hypothetical protein
MALGPEEKKKAYLLAGLAGLLGIAGIFLFRPASPPDAEAPTPLSIAQPEGGSSSSPSGPPANIPPVPGGGGPGAGSGAAPVAGAAARSGGQTPQLVAVERFRRDPFEQFYYPLDIPPTPIPPPPPPPTPAPPLDIPRPSSDDGGASFAGTALPPLAGSNRPETVLVGLPSARIPRLVNVPTTPRVQSAPVGQSSVQQSFERSTSSRLAGVVIGDSVRALLILNEGAADEKRLIVQPGQRLDADNIVVRRIERFTDPGGQTRARMIVEEAGVVRSVELREGIALQGGIEGGYPGGSSGYPGGSSGYPGSSSGGSGRRPLGPPGVPGP